ncbi:MAG: hypothetical protein HRT99_02105 [Mycoplasmatales bacterium]|nr:hypothetical protein [Mycoplasmatales bacterium]
MKYNTTYTPKISLKDTIIETDNLIENINKFYRSRFKITRLIPPMFSEENSETLINLDNITRPITFDMGSEYKIGQLNLSHSNWLRKMMKTMQMKPMEGFEILSSTIWRDISVTAVSSVTKNEIVYQIKLEDDVDMKKIVLEESKKLYELIYHFEKELSKKYSYSQIIPEKINIISAQMLENEFFAVEPKNREKEMIEEINSFLLKNPGDKLFSGNIHSEIPIEIYAQKNYYQIVIKNTANSAAIKVASISQIASGTLLSDQLSLGGKNYMKELDFYANEIKKEYNVIEIKINIGKLTMCLLQKGHIAEIQAGVISDESNIIKSRYKVEKY